MASLEPLSPADFGPLVDVADRKRVVDLLVVLEITPTVAALDRPGATDELAEAFHRGTACTCDFSAIDHLARAGEPIDAVRTECGIRARTH